MTTTLTDTQRKILVEAAARPDGGIVLPKRGRAGPVAAKTLLAQALVREVRAKADLVVWRTQADTGRGYGLVLTKAGRALVQTVDVTAAAEPAGHDSAGRGEQAGASGSPRTGTKLAEVVDLLQRDGGSSVTELMAATGWLAHTTRAALTGLRKRGYAVVRETAETGAVYRIATPTPVAAA